MSAQTRLPFGAMLCLIVTACGAAGGTKSDDTDGAGAGGAGSGSGGSTSAGGGFSAAGSPGTKPDGSCGYSRAETFRDPGVMLIVFDKSSSMEEDANGKKQGDPGFDAATEKWAVTTKVISTALQQAPSDASVGMYLFPSTTQGEDWCKPALGPSTPQVKAAKLATTLPAMLSYLNGPPGGSVTPLAQALYVGHQYLDTLSQVKGQKAVLLVTDGAPSPACGMANEETANVAKSAWDLKGFKTYVVGLDGSAEDLLSKTAHNGKTDRVPGCAPACGSGSNCCHYTAKGAGTAQQLADALKTITAQALTSCVFPIPKGSDPAKYDPDLVNVLVTVDGQPSELLAKDGNNGWSFTGPNNDSAIVNGPLCDAILAQPTKVEVLLGCPTGQIK